MIKKYKLTENTKIVNNKILYQIQAIRSFGTIEIGRLGGYIEKEYNLSHDGDCWLDVDASVLDNATILENAYIDNVIVCDNAIVKGNSRISGDGISISFIADNAKVCGNVDCACNFAIYGNSELDGDISIFDGNLYMGGNSKIYNAFHMYHGELEIKDNAIIHGDITINTGIISLSDNVDISGEIHLNGIINLYDNVTITGKIDIFGNIVSGNNIIINNDSKFIIASFYDIPELNSNSIYILVDNDVYISKGNFFGTLDNFYKECKNIYNLDIDYDKFDHIKSVLYMYFNLT